MLQNGSLFGEAFASEVKKQIELREYIFGQGFQPSTLQADQQDLFTATLIQQRQYLNSNASWIKVISSVDTKRTARFKNTAIAGLQSTIMKQGVNKLASEFILNAGVKSNGGQLRGGLNIAGEPVDVNSRNTGGRDLYGYPILPQGDAYGVGGIEYGIRPMPGITSATVEHLNNGTLRKAVVQLKAYNRAQFEIIDALYLRIGYTLLIEWGHTIIAKGTPNSPTYERNPDIYSLQSQFLQTPNKGDYESYLAALRKNRLASQGNYDGFIGRITNFSWVQEKDGSYSVTLFATSAGDVIETLNLNIKTAAVSAFVDSETTANKQKLIDEEGEDIDPRYLNVAPSSYEKLQSAAGYHELGAYLAGAASSIRPDIVNKAAGITQAVDPTALQTEARVDNTTNIVTVGKYKNIEIDALVRIGVVKLTDDQQNQLIAELGGTPPTTQTATNAQESSTDNDTPSTEASIETAASFAGSNKTFDIIAIPFNDDTIPSATNTTGTVTAGEQKYFVRFGALLEVLEKRIIPKNKKTGKPIVTIDYNPTTNIIAIDTYTVPADPSVCIFKRVNVPVYEGTYEIVGGKPLEEGEMQKIIESNPVIATSNLNWQEQQNLQQNQQYQKAFKNTSGTQSQTAPTTPSSETDAIPPLKKTFKGTKLIAKYNFFDAIEQEFVLDPTVLKNAGRLMNVYFNTDYVLNTFESCKDSEKMTVSLYNFLQKLVEGFCSSTGNYNKLTVFYDEDTNKLKIIDKTVPPNYRDFLKYRGITPAYSVFNLYGFRPKLTKQEGLVTLDYYRGSFINDFSIQTQLTKETSNMIAVASAANTQNILGLESTMFSKWNEGLEDRILPEIQDATATGDDDNNADSIIIMFQDFAKLASKLGSNQADIGAVDFDTGSPKPVKIVNYNVKDFGICKNVLVNIVKYNQNKLAQEKGTQSTMTGFLPIKLSITMKGLSGMKILQEFKINSSFLPSNYPTALRFLVSNIKHELNNNQWNTTIDTIVVPESTIDYVNNDDQRDVQAIQQAVTNTNAIEEGFWNVTPTYTNSQKRQLIDVLGWPIIIKTEGRQYFGKVEKKVGDKTFYFKDPNYVKSIVNVKEGNLSAQVHQKAEPTVRLLLKALIAKGYNNNKYLDSFTLGAYNNRSTPGQPSSLSGHAWGISLDINADTFPRGKDSVTKLDGYVKYTQAVNNPKSAYYHKAQLIKFIADNFVTKAYPGADKMTWGGNYKGTKDTHHFNWKYNV